MASLLNLPSINRRRFIVLIGDEGAVLTHMVGREVRRRVFAATADGDAADALMEALEADPTARISILLDYVEQQFREVDVPKVAITDRPKVVRRRLALTFPEDHLSGALPIPGVETRREKRYLFAAVPMSSELRAWLKRLATAPNPIDSMALLPLEVVPLIQALRGEPDREGQRGRSWQLLLTHQRCSGFRQTIVQNGRLVFTRLTPNLEDGGSADTVDDIEREFASTVSYLRRLSFSDADRVELIVLAEPAVCAQLDSRRLRVRALTAMSPAEAAERLGLSEVADPEDGYSDILQSAWFAQRGRPALSLLPDTLARAGLLTRLPRVAMAASLAVAAVGLTGTAIGGFEAWSLAGERAEMRERQQRLEREGRALRADLEALSTSPARIEAALDTFTGLTQAMPRIGTLVREVAAGLEPNMQVKAFSVAPAERDAPIAERFARIETSRGRDRRDTTAPDLRQVVMNLTVQISGPFQDRRDILDRYDALVARLRAALPDHDIQITRDPLAESGSALQGSAGLGVDEGARRLPQVVDSDIRITGPA